MNKIAKWLKEYAQDKALVVGVSGGIDSAVTSTLCAETGLTTYALNIAINSSSTGQELAYEHLKWLRKYENVKVRNLELTDTFHQFLSDVDFNHDHANANTKSRLRMVALYYYATVYDGLVVGTGNKVEDFGVGFFTKYGDGGVDISPIANLYKSEVRELGKKLGVLQQIIDAKPTDGLWGDNRTDEDQLGISYEELEAVMQGAKASPEAQEKYWELHNNNLHKMIPVPVYRGKW